MQIYLKKTFENTIKQVTESARCAIIDSTDDTHSVFAVIVKETK